VIFNVSTKAETRKVKLLQSKIKGIPHPPASANTPQAEQRVREEPQRLIDDIPIFTVPGITDVPPMMQVRNPTANRALKITPWLHQRLTQNNNL
jgi:hypothetical protein